MAFRIFKKKKPKEDYEKIEAEESMFGGLQTIEDSKSIQLSSPLLERDILDIPHSQLNITYPVDPPYAYVNIFYDAANKEMLYRVIEPGLTKREENMLDSIKKFLEDTIELDFNKISGERLQDYIREEVDNAIKKYRIRMNRNSYERLIYYAKREFIGYNWINPIYRDPNIEDISCDGPGIPLYIFHRNYESMKTSVIIPSHTVLDSFALKIAQRCKRNISVAEPLLDGSLPDGSRVQLTLGKEVTMHGTTFTIRKFREDPLTPPDLITFGTFNPAMLALLWFFMEKGISILIAGGTASGKTTTLNSVAMFIKPEMKIVTIEDTSELNLAHENWIPAVTRGGFGPVTASGKRMGEVDMFDLLRAALRQRPDYIIVGEVRGREAYTLFQAIATGHAALGTIHADSPQGVVYRLESDPINVPRIMIKNLDVILLQARVRVKGRITRRITHLVEVVDLDPSTKEVITNTVYEWDPFNDAFRFTGRSYMLERLEKEKGVSVDDMLNEIKTRQDVLNWMRDNKVRHYKDVSALISEYYRNPAGVIEKIGG